MAAGSGRRCDRCRALLARDNAGVLCGPCKRAARALAVPPDVPPDFWENESLRSALVSERHIGRAVRCYRHHPFFGHRPVPQEVAARWLGISQAQLGRIETGRQVDDLRRLIQWARILRIPEQLLWFSMPGDSPKLPALDSALEIAGDGGTGKGRVMKEEGPNLLRVLVTRRHWQRFETFEAQFSRAARSLAEQEGEPGLATVSISARQFERWIYGALKTEPWPDASRILEHMFGYPIGQLMGSADDSAGSAGAPDGRRRALSVGSEEVPDSGVRHGRADMEIPTPRRDFVILGGSVVAGNLLSAVESELGRINMALSRGSTHEERIQYLEDVADDLGVEVERAAPMAALGPALQALTSVRTLLEERQATRYQARLVAVSSKLSTVIGEQVFNMGQFRQAREWHRTALYAAFDAGSQYLADISLAQQAFGPIYAGDPAAALSLTATRIDGKPAPSPALAQIYGIRARAHAALGDSHGFKRSMESAWDCLDRSPREHVRPGIFSFRPANLAFYETTGAVALSDLDTALDAAGRALGLFRDQDRIDMADSVLVRLSRATALARSGEIGEACNAARAAIADADGYYTLCVRTYAHEFSSEVRPVDSRHTREWHEALAEAEAGQG
jgi:transcriptional regulator with XRE-family HTH domain